MPSPSPQLSESHLVEGDIYNEAVLHSDSSPTLTHTLVAAAPETLVLLLGADAIESVLAGASSMSGSRVTSRKDVLATPTPAMPLVAFSDLVHLRVVGTGQFGMVRVVQHRVTGEVYALKIMHKVSGPGTCYGWTR